MWHITEHAADGRRALSPAAFESQFLAVCAGHRAQGRALAFAFILFDSRHPHLRKALEDDAYWEALDELSGRYLTVFSFLAYLRNRSPDAPLHGVRAMVSIPRLTSETPIDLLATYFPGLSREQLPCILFFQVSNDAVIDSCAVSLGPSTDPAAAYNEIADVLQTAIKSIGRVEDEN